MTKTISAWAAALACATTLAFLVAYSSFGVAFAASSLFGGATNSGGEVTLVSDMSDANATNDYSGISFDDLSGQPFSALTTLSSDYNVTDDDCGAGSPRFQVRLDENDNGIDDVGDGNILVYFGPSPSFTNCDSGWQSTGNLVGNNDAGRWDSGQITGGVNSGTYAQALTAAGSLDILGISIVVDSGWNADAANGDSEQTNLIDDVTINSAVYDFEPEPVTVTIVKYVDGEQATAANADNQSFPMQSSWDADNMGAGSGTYSLAPSSYEAETSSMSSGADYATNEVTSGEVVGASCADGKPFALAGYSTGDTETEASSNPVATTSPAFTNITSDKYVIVWNETCDPEDVTVTILKYVDGEHATAANADSATFPFTATYDASNIGSGSDPFTIGPVGNNTPNPYEAKTIALASGADYKAEENTSGNEVVGASCDDGKPFALEGYTSGDTLEAAQTGTMSESAPAFTDLTNDKYLIVWNEPCDEDPEPSVELACETPTVAPEGYTLQNGTSRNENVTLAPNTMFVGNGGNDKVSGPDGNYIVCTGSGNDTITLGNGDTVINAGSGNNKVMTGNGSGHVTTGSGNDTITVGTGDHTIDAGGANNTINTGDGVQNVTTGSGNDKVTTGNGNDTINVAGGNNTVNSGGGDDSITAQNGNDKINGGAGSADACSAGGGNNTVTNCEV